MSAIFQCFFTIIIYYLTKRKPHEKISNHATTQNPPGEVQSVSFMSPTSTSPHGEGDGSVGGENLRGKKKKKTTSALTTGEITGLQRRGGQEEPTLAKYRRCGSGGGSVVRGVGGVSTKHPPRGPAGSCHLKGRRVDNGGRC